MSELPPKPESSEEPAAEWPQLYRRCFAASSRILTVIEEEMGAGNIVNPQAAGVVLVLCMGRLQGRYGYRSIGAEACWKGWGSADLFPLFETAFRGERAQED